MPDENKKMSCDEFSSLRDSLGLTLNEGAKILGIAVDTMRIYEGKKKRSRAMGPHPTAVIYLQAIKDNPDFTPPFWPERLMENED